MLGGNGGVGRHPGGRDLRAADRRSTIDYQQQVHPILAAKCLPCHSAQRRSGGLSLASYADALDGGRSGAAIHPGDAQRQHAGAAHHRRAAAEDAARATALLPAEIDTLRKWIDQGARETPTSAAAKSIWQAPLAIERSGVPETTWPEWTGPLDRFVASYLAERGVAEPPLVDGRDVCAAGVSRSVGMLPPPDELQAFVVDAARASALALVDRLLGDNEKYARALDLVLERSAAQRRRRELLTRRRLAQEHHGMAARRARNQPAVQPDL